MADRAQPERSSLLQWFAMLGPPVVWAIHFSVTYSLAAIACTARFANVEVLGLTALQIIMVGTAAAALLVILVASRVTYGSSQNRGSSADRGGDEQAERRTYMGQMGTMLGILFAALVVIETVPVFIIEPCWRAP